LSNGKSMESMFNTSSFDGDIGDLDVSNVENMGGMFRSSGFDGDISDWDTSNITNMRGMFDNAEDFDSDSGFEGEDGEDDIQPQWDEEC